MLYRVQGTCTCGYEGDYGRGVLGAGRAHLLAHDQVDSFVVNVVAGQA